MDELENEKSGTLYKYT